MSEGLRRNIEIVDLLTRRKAEDIERALTLTDQVVLDRSPSLVLDLVLRLIDSEQSDFALDLISFLDEEALGVVAQRCVAGDSEGRSRCLEQIALQRQDCVPTSIVDAMIDFETWRDEPETLRPPMHLIFEHGARSQVFFTELVARNQHPTWDLPAQAPSFRFGGPGATRCPSCGQSAIHILTIDQEVPGIDLPKGKTVIETCPTCWTEAFYRHGPDGTPTRIDPIAIEGYRWDNIPLVESRVRLAVTPRRWVHQSWAHSNSRQNLSRLGGLPSWIQDSQTPVVPGTDRKMRLLLQVDSHFPLIDGRGILWGSGGIRYVFWDEATRTSCHFAQWT